MGGGLGEMRAGGPGEEGHGEGIGGEVVLRCGEEFDGIFREEEGIGPELEVGEDGGEEPMGVGKVAINEDLVDLGPAGNDIEAVSGKALFAEEIGGCVADLLLGGGAVTGGGHSSIGKEEEIGGLEEDVEQNDDEDP